MKIHKLHKSIRELHGLYVMLCMLVVAFCVSCSSTQKITVKQEQEGQIQETVIESDTKVNSFSMVITSDKIEYNGSVYRPKPTRNVSYAKSDGKSTLDVQSAEHLRQRWNRG